MKEQVIFFFYRTSISPGRSQRLKRNAQHSQFVGNETLLQGLQLFQFNSITTNVKILSHQKQIFKFINMLFTNNNLHRVEHFIIFNQAIQEAISEFPLSHVIFTRGRFHELFLIPSSPPNSSFIGLKVLLIPPSHD